MGYRLSNLAVGGKMHDGVDRIGLERFLKFLCVGKVAQDKETTPDSFPVAGLKVIVDNRTVVLADELLNHMATNVSSPTCD